MPRFFQKVGELVRGESESEGEERRRYEKEIRMESRKASLEARKEEAIKFAKRKQQIISEARERRLKQQYAPRTPQKYSSPFGSGIGLGYSSPVRSISRKSKKKSRKKFYRRPTNRYRRPTNRYIDIIGL